jgi:hypothetical protein
MSTLPSYSSFATIEPDLAERWWVAIDAAGAAIDAAAVDHDLSDVQAGVKRQALLAERRWIETVRITAA